MTHNPHNTHETHNPHQNSQILTKSSQLFHGDSQPESSDETFTPQETLAIIECYSNKDSDYVTLGKLYSVLSPHTPLIKEKEYKHINNKILSIIAGKRESTSVAAAEIYKFIDSSEGNFSTLDIYNALCAKTKQEKDVIRYAIHKAMKEGKIASEGKKSGVYRRLEKDVNVIDWRNASGEEYPVVWPLGIHELVKLYPGNIAVIAGASNTGKTSFLIELIRLNNRSNPNILYANSEMAASELRLRIEAYPEDLQRHQPWNFTAIERSSNFADIIRPDGFNIIDFMEVYDEFWKIGAWIRDVHEKLTTGIAVIAIQKKAKTKQSENQYGRGGELTLEKPRLYLSMDRGEVKIVKGKIWRSQERNPNGMVRRFKLAGGWRWMPQGEWMHEEEAQRHSKYGDIVDPEVKKEGGYL